MSTSEKFLHNLGRQAKIYPTPNMILEANLISDGNDTWALNNQERSQKHILVHH